MILLIKGALLDAVDEMGNTPLIISLLSGYPNFALMLLQQGADIQRDITITQSMFDLDSNNKNIQTLGVGQHSMFRLAIING